MAEIWRGITTDGCSVAVKVLLKEYEDDETTRRRFARECALTMDLRHPQTARGLDQGIDADGRQYLVTEYLDGPTLDQFIGSMGPLSVHETVFIMARICSILEDFHAREIFHRDLKPANVMLDSYSEHAEARLIDFGIAAAPDFATLTGDREILGTLQYMTPEQVYGSPIRPVEIDMWGLSALAYETLIGRPAFDAPSLGELCASIRKSKFVRPSTLRSDIGKEADDFFARCFSSDRQQRYTSIEAWLRDLARALRVALENTREPAGSSRCQFASGETATAVIAASPGRPVCFPRAPEKLCPSRSHALGARHDGAPQGGVAHQRWNYRRWLTVAAAAIFFTGVSNAVDLSHLAAQWALVWP